MSRRIAALVTVAAIAVAASPALAAPKKPKTVSGSYAASALPPDPSPFVLGSVGSGANCTPTVPAAKHEKAISLPAPGTLQVDLTGFQGDWDLAVLNSKGQMIGDSAQDMVSEPIDKPEKVKLKIKSKGTYTIRACNFAGGPSANVKWVHTY